MNIYGKGAIFGLVHTTSLDALLHGYIDGGTGRYAGVRGAVVTDRPSHSTADPNFNGGAKVSTPAVLVRTAARDARLRRRCCPTRTPRQAAPTKTRPGRPAPVVWPPPVSWPGWRRRLSWASPTSGTAGRNGWTRPDKQ